MRTEVIHVARPDSLKGTVAKFGTLSASFWVYFWLGEFRLALNGFKCVDSERIVWGGHVANASTTEALLLEWMELAFPISDHPPP